MPSSSSTCPNRTVIFAGPHKTGSTSIQDFFERHATDDLPDAKLAAFADWNTPKANKWMCRHVQWLHRNETNPKFRKKAKNGLGKATRTGHNLFFACEYFSTALETEGAGWLENMLEWTALSPDCDNVEIVLHYRTPRVEQWLSAWQQFTAPARHADLLGMSLREFHCLPKSRVWSQFATRQVLHPLRLARKFRELDGLKFGGETKAVDFKVTIVDMGGIGPAGLVQNLACDVMGVDCNRTTGSVRGLDEPPRKSNERERDDTVVKPKLRSELEALFRNRDCLYQKILEDDPKVTIQHRDTLWQDCPTNMTQHEPLDDPDYFEAQIHKMLNCPYVKMASPALQFPSEYELDLGVAQIGIVAFLVLAYLSKRYITRRETQG